MKRIIFLLSILITLLSCKKKVASAKQGSEEFYKKEIQKNLGGKLEYVVKNGRIDLLTDEVAYEVAWASDWKESIGKSLWYGMQTHRDAGIILIKNHKSDDKYLNQLKATIEYINGNKEIHVLAFPDDF